MTRARNLLDGWIFSLTGKKHSILYFHFSVARLSYSFISTLDILHFFPTENVEFRRVHGDEETNEILFFICTLIWHESGKFTRVKRKFVSSELLRIIEIDILPSSLADSISRFNRLHGWWRTTRRLKEWVCRVQRSTITTWDTATTTSWTPSMLLHLAN